MIQPIGHRGDFPRRPSLHDAEILRIAAEWGDRPSVEIFARAHMHCRGVAVTDIKAGHVTNILAALRLMQPNNPNGCEKQRAG